jgi:hypothetical protein
VLEVFDLVREFAPAAHEFQINFFRVRVFGSFRCDISKIEHEVGFFDALRYCIKPRLSWPRNSLSTSHGCRCFCGSREPHGLCFVPIGKTTGTRRDGHNFA